MTIITDPDNLVLTDQIQINTGSLTIGLTTSGSFTTDGVTLQCVYSKLKDLWKENANFIKFPFPMTAITEEKFEAINDWDWENAATRNLIRTGGWSLKTGSLSQEEYSGVITLGTLGGSDQVYYQQVTGKTGSNIVLTGAVNQAVKVYGDDSHGNFDYRAYFKIFCREYAKTYAMSQLSDIGVTTMTYQCYRFPLTNATDLKVSDTDETVETGSNYASMFMSWSGSAASRTIGGTPYNFHVFVTGDNKTAEQIYTYVQHQLREPVDIDSGSALASVSGSVASPILNFVGDSLYTLLYSVGSGSYIDGFNNTDINRLYFRDDTNTLVQYPYTASLTVQFGENLVADANAKYWVYFTNDDVPGDNLGYDFGTSNAILAKDASTVDMTYNIGGSGSMTLTYDYDGNDQRGAGSTGSNAPLTVVALGLTTAQYVKATGTIARSTTNSVSLVAPLERNYTE